MSKGCVLNLGALDGLDAGMIAQEPGDSPSLVMSQKAVTDLVNQTALGIAPEVNVPRFEQTLYFTGQPITPEFTGFFEGCLEIGGTTSATQAGKYKAAFTPLPGYVWPDGTRHTVEVEWEILKADGLCQLSASSTSVIKGSSAAITVTRKENAAVTVTSSDGSIVQGAVSGNVVTLLGSKRGNAVLTIRTAETTNFAAAEATLPVSVLEVVQVPTQAGTLTYSSAAQSPVWNGYSVPSDALILSGTTFGVNAGEYEAIFSLKDNWCWPDGTTAQKYVKWKINKATGSLTVSPTSVTLNNANPTATINITQVGDGALTVTSSNPGVVTATLDGKTINLGG